MALRFGQRTYHAGALGRLEDARRLLTTGRIAGSVYCGGRAVEGMFRALIWASAPSVRQGVKSLQTGHDLRQMLHYLRQLGLLPSHRADLTFTAEVQHVARLWDNNFRFASTAEVERYWVELGEVKGKRTSKVVAGEFYLYCTTLMKRSERLWQR